jgi:cytoskeletal protein CcmA (bactofilin family)
VVTLTGASKGNYQQRDPCSGEDSVVYAQIHSNVLKIAGEIHGDLTATEKIELYPPAKIYGNIRTPSLVVEEGVIFEGTCSMASVKAETLSLSEPEHEHAGDEEPLESISAQAWPPSNEERDSLTDEVPDKTALHKLDR